MVDIQIKPDSEKYTLEELYRIIEILRSPEGCPWDRVQTHKSLTKGMVEEAYETVDAINKESTPKMIEELGDVLLQVIFHSIIGTEDKEFGFDDVIDGCARKMIFRHSHVFGDVSAQDSKEALVNWEKMKTEEKGFTSLSEELDDIPEVFPATLRAQKVYKRIKKAGKNIPDDMTNNIDFSQDIGKILFTVCCEAEKQGIDSDLALREYTKNVMDKAKRDEL